MADRLFEGEEAVLYMTGGWGGTLAVAVSWTRLIGGGDCPRTSTPRDGSARPFDGTLAPPTEDDVQRVGSPSPGETLILRPSRSRASSDATHRSPDSPTTNFIASQTRSRRPTSPKA